MATASEVQLALPRRAEHIQCAPPEGFAPGKDVALASRALAQILLLVVQIQQLIVHLPLVLVEAVGNDGGCSRRTVLATFAVRDDHQRPVVPQVSDRLLLRLDKQLRKKAL